MDNIKKSFVSGSFWTILQNVITSLLGVVQLSLTSRMLNKTDFGIYAIAFFFYTLSSIAFSMGLSNALIQKKENIDSYLSTSWLAGLGIAIIASIIIMIFTPILCSWYFHNRESVFPSVIILLSGIIISASNPRIIYLLKETCLRKYFLINIIPKVISFLVTLLIVYLTKSYWGLIIGFIVDNLGRCLISYIIVPFKIGKIHFDKRKFIELYNFGGWIQLKNILYWLSSNLDVAIVGNLLSVQNLGLYNRAQNISGYPRTLINAIVNTVAFPIYSKINSNPIRTNAIVNDVENGILLILSSISVITILFGENIINLILGPKWLDMVLPFKIIMIAYVFQAYLFSFNSIIRAYGLTKGEFVYFSIEAIIMILLLYPFTIKWGLVGAGFAVLLASIMSLPYLFYLLYKIGDVNIKSIISSLFISIISSVATIFFIYLLCYRTLDINTSIFIWALLVIVSIVCLLFVFTLFAMLTNAGPGMTIIKNIKLYIHEKS